MKDKKGSSLVMWTVTFSIALALLFFIRPILKTNLQGYVMRTADCLFYTHWGNETDQYKGSISSFSKTRTNRQQVKADLEKKDKTVNTYNSYQQDEVSASSAAQEGSELVLKTFDLDAIVP
jgi:hypothetical protein